MKVKKIPPPNIPKSHYKWAGIETEEEKKEEKKNNLDADKLDKLVKKVYDKKYGTYSKTGEFIVHETETEIQDWNSAKND